MIFRKGEKIMASRTKNAVFVLIISLVMAALRTVIVITNMEKSSPRTDIYYLPENAVVVAFTVATFVLLAAFAFMAFRFSGRARVALDHKSAAVSVGALIVSFALIGVAIFQICLLFTDAESGTAQIVAVSGQNASDGISSIEVLTAFFASASAVKFFVQGISNTKKIKHNPVVYASAMLLPIFFSSFHLLNAFISNSAAPFASSGAYHIVALVATLMFFLLEGKSCVTETRSFLFDFFGYAAVYLLLVYSVPHAIVHCIGVLTFDVESAMALVDVTLAIYIVTRLSTTKKLRPKKEQALELE